MVSLDLSETWAADMLPDYSAEKLCQDFCSLLGQKMSLELLVLWTYRADKGQLNFYAFLTDQGLLLRTDRVVLSSEGKAEFNELLKKKCHLFPDSRNSLGIKDLVEVFPVPEPFTTIIIQAELDTGFHVAVSLCASDVSSYNESDLEFIKTQYEKLTLYLKNMLTACEVEKLKKSAIAERDTLLKRLGYVGTAAIIGSESGLHDTMELVRQVAPLNTTVLITGETGVGKEVIANAIHRASGRSSQPLVSVNCGAIPESLLDSELFGHEKGAFTDAHQTKHGYFEQANEGTIFLDEVGELSFSAQVRLLRLLQERQYQRVGGSRAISVDVRVIAATNRDLVQLVENGQFRSDLWFRINTFPIHVPPLRERKEDIPLLARYFSRVKGKEMALQWTGQFKDGAMAQLQAYDWPGNVRELQSVIERSLILSQGKPMFFPNLQLQPVDLEDFGPENVPVREMDESTASFTPLNEVIAAHIKRALVNSKGRVEGKQGAAELLELHPSTLRAKMRKLGITCKRYVE